MKTEAYIDIRLAAGADGPAVATALCTIDGVICAWVISGHCDLGAYLITDDYARTLANIYNTAGVIAVCPCLVQLI